MLLCTSARQSAIYLVGDTIAPNIFRYYGAVERLKIDPKLPDSLTFDTLTGTIRGKPKQAAPLTVYSIIAIGEENSDTLKLSITLIDTTSKPTQNHAPQWDSASFHRTCAEGAAYSLILSDILRDQDINDTLKVVFASQSTDSIGLITKNTLGKYLFSCTPGYSDSGSKTITFTATDGLASAQTTLYLHINNTNRPPTFITNKPKSSYLDSAGKLISVSYEAQDADNDQITYKIASSLPRAISVDSLTRIITYQTQIADSGNYQIKIVAKDFQDSTTALVDIGIGNVNVKPQISLPGFSRGANISIKEIRSFTDTFIISDQNLNQTKSFSAALGLPSSAVFDTTKGILSYTPAFGISSQTANALFSNVRIIGHDNGSPVLWDTFAIDITVLDSNRIPVADSQTISTARNAMVNFTLNSHDPDDDLPKAWAIVGGPFHGTASQTSFPTVTYTPQTNYAGTDSLYFKVSDGLAWSKVDTIRFRIANTLAAPRIITQPDSVAADSGSTASFTVVINTDVNPTPQFRWVKDNTDTVGTQQTLTFASVRYSNESRYKVVVRNSQQQVISNSTKLKVNDIVSPVITLIGSADTTVLLNSNFTDPKAAARDDRDGMLPQGNIQITGSVNGTAVGRYTLTYRVNDAAGNAAVVKSRVVKVEGWVPFGDSISEGSNYWTAMLADGTIIAGYFVDASKCIRLKKLVGTTWQNAANDLPCENPDWFRFAISPDRNSIYVVYLNSNLGYYITYEVNKLSGTTWLHYSQYSLPDQILKNLESGGIYSISCNNAGKVLTSSTLTGRPLGGSWSLVNKIISFKSNNIADTVLAPFDGTIYSLCLVDTSLFVPYHAYQSRNGADVYALTVKKWVNGLWKYSGSDSSIFFRNSLQYNNGNFMMDQNGAAYLLTSGYDSLFAAKYYSGSWQVLLPALSVSSAYSLGVSANNQPLIALYTYDPLYHFSLYTYIDNIGWQKIPNIVNSQITPAPASKIFGTYSFSNNFYVACLLSNENSQPYFKIFKYQPQ